MAEASVALRIFGSLDADCENEGADANARKATRAKERKRRVISEQSYCWAAGNATGRLVGLRKEPQ